MQLVNILTFLAIISFVESAPWIFQNKRAVQRGGKDFVHLTSHTKDMTTEKCLKIT